jgi:hypothetical protein
MIPTLDQAEKQFNIVNTSPILSLHGQRDAFDQTRQPAVSWGGYRHKANKATSPSKEGLTLRSKAQAYRRLTF